MERVECRAPNVRMLLIWASKIGTVALAVVTSFVVLVHLRGRLLFYEYAFVLPLGFFAVSRKAALDICVAELALLSSSHPNGRGFTRERATMYPAFAELEDVGSEGKS